MFALRRASSVLRAPAMRAVGVSVSMNSLLAPASRALPAVSSLSLRGFSAAAVARGQGGIDRDLANQLEQELSFEKENVSAGIPSFISDFTNQGVFKIEDKVGDKEVTLVRNFGNEKISAIFSTDAVADKSEFDETENDSENEQIFSVNATIVIEKRAGSTDNGALELNTTIQDGAFYIDSVRFNRSSSLMVDQSAEADWQRSGRYGGPVFQDLDENLQNLFHDFLKERGFDENLAEFIPQYIDYKEQNEYMEWLKNVATWVSK